MTTEEELAAEAEERRLAAEEMDALMGTDQELEGLIPIKAHVAEHVLAVLSVRMMPGELTELMSAAAVVGERVSDFVRRAALERARSPT